MIPIVAAYLSFASNQGIWTLKDGTRVSLAFYQPSANLAWHADSSLIDAGIIARNLPEKFFDSIESPVLLAWIAQSESTGQPADEPCVRFKLPSTNQVDAGLLWLSRDGKRWIGGLATKRGQPSQQDVAVGVATGPWTPKGSVSFSSNKKGLKVTSKMGADFAPIVVEDPTSQPGKPTTTISVRLPESVLKEAVSLTIQDKKGKSTAHPISLASLDNMHGTKFTIDGNYKDVKKIELQTRLFEWHTILAAHFRAK